MLEKELMVFLTSQSHFNPGWQFPWPPSKWEAIPSAHMNKMTAAKGQSQLHLFLSFLIELQTVCFIRDTVYLRYVRSLKFSKIMTWLVPILFLVFLYRFSVHFIYFVRFTSNTVSLFSGIVALIFPRAAWSCPLIFLKFQPVPYKINWRKAADRQKCILLIAVQIAHKRFTPTCSITDLITISWIYYLMEKISWSLRKPTIWILPLRQTDYFAFEHFFFHIRSQKSLWFHLGVLGTNFDS